MKLFMLAFVLFFSKDAVAQSAEDTTLKLGYLDTPGMMFPIYDEWGIPIYIFKTDVQYYMNMPPGKMVMFFDWQGEFWGFLRRTERGYEECRMEELYEEYQ